MLTLERLKEALWYDDESGRFFWNTKVKGIRIGTEAGSFDAHGYGQIRIDRKVYKEHRLAWLYMTGRWPTGQIDHINHQRRDNHFRNLREVDNTTNHTNRPLQRNNATGVIGVSYCKRIQRFEAYITVDGCKKNLGNYKTLNEAAQARAKASQEFGFHKNHGVGYGISKRKPRLKTSAVEYQS